jgi:hypothetical protein
MIPKIFLLMALASSVVFWSDQTQKGIEIRKHSAAEWSGLDAEFVATGIDNSTLLAVMPGEDPVMCDAYVDSIAIDQNARWLLKSRGFTALKCLDRVLILR